MKRCILGSVMCIRVRYSVKELAEHKFLNNGLAKIGNTTIELANLPVLSKDTPNFVVPELGEHTKLITDEFFN